MEIRKFSYEKKGQRTVREVLVATEDTKYVNGIDLGHLAIQDAQVLRENVDKMSVETVDGKDSIVGVSAAFATAMIRAGWRKFSKEKIS